MNSTSYIEISESAIENNINFIKNLLGDEVIFSSVVKGNAYGHSIKNYCPLAYKYGIRHFSVADANEAQEVLEAIPREDTTIMIMGMIENQQLEWAIENGIEFYLFESDRMEAALKAAKKAGKPAKVHLEIETGMNRTGFETDALHTVLACIKSNPDHLVAKGLCTHLAGAESIANFKRVTDQQERFKQIANDLDAQGWDFSVKHMASSAATVKYPETRYDLVRVGILQYGFFPTEEIHVHYLERISKVENPLKRVVSWKTTVMEVKTVEMGEFIGYGTSFFTNETTTIAIIPVGYSSGYNRSLSNVGKVLINGKRLGVIGTINMNMMAVDITSAKEVKKGDEVVLIGKQGDQEITVSSFSDFSQMINYELLTRLSREIPRILIP